jgi:putative nucleotidyltransferase with HDIG domain
MVILVAFKIYRTMPHLWADTRRLALLSLIVLLSVFGLKIGATMLGVQFSSGQLGYLGMSSVAAAGMLVCVLLDVHLAVLIAALLSVQSGLIMNHEIRFTVMTLMGSLVGISCVDKLRRQSNLPQIALVLSATNLGMVLLLGLLMNDSRQELLTGSGWAIGSAVLAIFLFWMGVLLLEKPFGILTHTTLLELSQFDNPLLQQLCAVAPGTYAHSIMVGTLSEAGANAIGANGLLCRVGGYYHDIGKMKRPDFFVENQRKENVHGRLSPSLSALIITAHVRDGLDLAKEHRLPQEIKDIIAQHHGTTLIRYFYHQALMDCGGAEEAPAGLEERFRYPGPLPQNREAAVVMLADTIEAATRTLDKPSPERLEAMIQSLVHDKLDDGQLNECDLTFRDIKNITDAFMHVLRAMMHERIDYPQMPNNATGTPMEVLRDDLRPEPVAGQLPSLGRAQTPARLRDLGATNAEPQREEEAQEIAYVYPHSERADAPRPNSGTTKGG